MKRYFRIRRGFPMRLFIEEDRYGYFVRQFDGKNSKVLDYGLILHAQAVRSAKEWQEYYRNLGRDARVIDMIRR